MERGRVEKGVFMTDGCGPTIACGSTLTRMAQGKSLAEAAAIEAAEVIIACDGLPAEHLLVDVEEPPGHRLGLAWHAHPLLLELTLDADVQVGDHEDALLALEQQGWLAWYGLYFHRNGKRVEI